MKNQKLSNFIAKEIITLDNGQNIGYVLDCCFDAELTKLIGFVVADEESERENFLPISEVKTIGENYIFVESSYKLDLGYQSYSNSPIGKTIIDQEGQNLGKVFEVELEGNKLSKIITEKCEISAKWIYACGVDCLFFGNKKPRKKRGVNINKFDKNGYGKVEIQSINPYPEMPGKNNFKIENIQNKKVVTPTKIILTPPSLVNKTATCDLYGFNNELIIRKGQIITEAKIDKAKKHNKLNLLIINSK